MTVLFSPSLCHAADSLWCRQSHLTPELTTRCDPGAFQFVTASVGAGERPIETPDHNRTVRGEPCQDKRHFDCIGFVSTGACPRTHDYSWG